MKLLGMISAETGQVFHTVELPRRFAEIQVDNLAFARSLNLQAAQPGDINQDGTVGFDDVSPFVSLLTGGGFQIEADFNQDGEVDFWISLRLFEF